MKVLYKVRDGKEWNYTNLMTSVMLAEYAMMFKGMPDRVGMIKGLIVRCSDVMTRCLRTGHGDQAP